MPKKPSDPKKSECECQVIIIDPHDGTRRMCRCNQLIETPAGTPVQRKCNACIGGRHA